MKLRSSPIRPFVAGAAALILALLLLAAAAVPRSAAAADDDHPRTNPDPTAAAIVAGHGGRRILESSGSGNIFDQRTSTKKSHKGKKRANKKKQKKKVTLAEDDEVYLVQDISISDDLWTIFIDEDKTESEEMHIKALWTSSVPGESIKMTAFWESGDGQMFSLTFDGDTLIIFSSENNKIEVKVAGVPAVKLVTDGETGEVYATVQQKNPIEVKSIMLNGQTVTPQEFKTEFQVAGETNFCTNSFLSQLLYTEIISMYSNSTGQCREYWELCLLSMPFVENHATALGAFVEWTGCFESMMTISGDPKKQEIHIYPEPQVSN